MAIPTDALKQVLLNLVRNAQEALGAAGSIEIVVEAKASGPRFRSRTTGRASTTRRFLTCSTRSSRRRPTYGAWVWASHRGRPRPYARREDHRGESIGGTGAVLTVELPLASGLEERAAHGAGSVGRGDSMTAARLLIVDDDPTFRMSTAALMGGWPRGRGGWRRSGGDRALKSPLSI